MSDVMPGAEQWASAAFPAGQQDDAWAVAALLPPARLAPASPFRVRVGGEALTVPYRIYNAEPDDAAIVALSPTQRIMVGCLYTRHHDGRVRQRHLRSVLGEVRPWVAPFVVQLVGEYVVQIIVDIRDGLTDLDTPSTETQTVYGAFGAANSEFMTVTRQRVVSYWNCYYRGLWPDRRYYPGSQVIESLRKAALPYRS